MLKRFVLFLVLALPFVPATSVAKAESPWPQCLPCEDGGGK